MVVFWVRRCVVLYVVAVIPNVAVERLAFLLLNLDVSGSDLGPETGCLDRGFSLFSSVLPGECWHSTLKWGHDCFLPNPFQFIIHVSSLYSTQRCLSYWKSAVKLKTNNRGSIPGRGKGFCLPLCPNQSWGPPKPPVKWVPVILSRGWSAAGRDANCSSHLVPRSGMSRVSVFMCIVQISVKIHDE
jgi:hypothetical protein